MKDHNSDNKRIAKNTFYVYFRLILVLIVSLFTVRIVLKCLGADDYGLFNVIVGFVSMFGFLNASMANGTQRFLNFEKGLNGESNVIIVFNTALKIQLIIAIIVFLVIEAIGIWYINNKMVIPPGTLYVANWLFQFAVISLLLNIIQVPYLAIILAYERMNFYATIGIIDVILKLIVAIYISFLSSGQLFSYGLMLMLISVIGSLLCIFYCKNNFNNIKTNLNYSNNILFKEMFTFACWNTFGSFAYVIRNQGINLLLNSFFGVIVNAANALAMQASNAIQHFSSNISVAFKPQLVQSYAQKDYARTEAMFNLMTKAAFILFYTISIPIMIELKYVLYLWLGNDVPYNTANFTMLTLIAMLISTFHIPIAQVILATGKIKKFQIVTSIIIASVVPISWIALYNGANALSVYWITIILYCLNQLAGLIILKQYFNFMTWKYLRLAILPCIIYTIILPIPGLIIKNVLTTSFIRLSLIGISTFIFGAVIIYLFLLTRSEKQFINKLFNGVLQKFKLSKYVNL